MSIDFERFLVEKALGAGHVDGPFNVAQPLLESENAVLAALANALGLHARRVDRESLLPDELAQVFRFVHLKALEEACRWRSGAAIPFRADGLFQESIFVDADADVLESLGTSSIPWDMAEALAEWSEDGADAEENAHPLILLLTALKWTRRFSINAALSHTPNVKEPAELEDV